MAEIDDLRAELECAKQEVAELRAKLSAVEVRAEKAEAERSRLAAFAREIISVECWGYPPEIDGGDMHDVAEKLGLIEACIATEADLATMNDVCVGDCSFLLLYRFAPWLGKNKDERAVLAELRTKLSAEE